MSKPGATLLDRDVQQCPFPFYASLRKDTPVRFMPELSAYYIANYELGKKVLIDAKQFAKKTAESDGRRFIEPNKAAQEILRTRDVGLPMSMMAQREGAEHRAYRGLVESYFQAGSVRKLEGHITATATELLEGIAADDEFEAVTCFAIPLPLYVISDLLGIPKSDYLTFKRWSDGAVTYMAMAVSQDKAIAGAEAMIEMHRYMLDQVAKRRSVPADDMLNVLAQARYDGRLLTDREICGFTDELLVAGNETTTSMLAAGLLHLSQNAEFQSRLRNEPALIPKFVEELLRTATPLQIALRFSLVDINLGGVDIPAGSKIFVGLASANRDEEAFADAGLIDPSRSGGKAHVTFGAGVHHCLGAELARLELRIAFRLWLERFASIELAQDPATIKYPASYAIRGPLSVRLRGRNPHLHLEDLT